MLILPSSTATSINLIAPVVEGSQLENGTCHSVSIRAIIVISNVTGKEAINASVPKSVSLSTVVPTDCGKQDQCERDAGWKLDGGTRLGCQSRRM